MINMDIYNKCVLSIKETLLESIREYINAYMVKSDVIQDNNLQNKINRYVNLRAYQCHRDDPSQDIANRVKERILFYKKSHDRTLPDLIEKFDTNYQELVYEFSQAEFLDRNEYPLVQRNHFLNLEQKSLSDWEIHYNFKTYFFECVTTNTSRMDEFIKILPNFDIYFNMATTFYNKGIELGYTNLEDNAPLIWPTLAEQIWYQFNEQQRNGIIMSFISMPPYHTTIQSIPSSLLHRKIIKKIDDWVDLNQYIYFYFPELLPVNLKNKLVSFLPITRSEDISKYIEFLTNRIVTIILGKLEKSYFDQNMPIILSISIAPLATHMISSLVINKLENISVFIQKKLREESTKKSIKITTQQLAARLRNLYAIIIDTTWYNWFPDIVERLHQVKFHDDNKNCYFIIYNNNTSESLKFDRYIFNRVIKNQIELPLTINTEEINL